MQTGASRRYCTEKVTQKRPGWIITILSMINPPCFWSFVVCVCVLQIHLKNRELENTKLSAELQMLKGVDVNKENTIAQLKDEVGCLRTCQIGRASCGERV